MECKEYILAQITTNPRKQEIHSAFGYTNKRGTYQLIAAVLATIDSEETQYVLVGASRTNYSNSKELNMLTYKQAMKTVNQSEWLKAIKVEHDKMKKYNVFKIVHQNNMPKNKKMIDYTWAMKKKSNRVYLAHLAAQGFKQIDGQHYKKDNKAAPVICDMAIKIVLTLYVMCSNWYSRITDVEGAFLNGSFQKKNKKIYTPVPKGMKRLYPAWAVLVLLATIYGTTQAALQWYREMYLSLNYLQWNKSNINPCLWYKWMDRYLIVFLLWVDDCFVVGPKQLVLEESTRFRKVYDTTDEDESDKYVSCKLTQTKEYLKLTQPVKIRRLIDEFGYSGKKSLQTPVKPKSNLAFEAKDSLQANETEAKKYASVIGMLLHGAQNSRPDCINPMQECSGFMSNVKKACIDHYDYLCSYIIRTKERGYMIKPNKTNWYGM